MVRRVREEEIKYERAVSGIACGGFDMGGRSTNPIPVRWVDVNSSLASPEYRSRLVVAETKSRSTIDPQDQAAVFASTLPLETVRVLCSLALSGAPFYVFAKDTNVVMTFLDISRAHHVEMKRTLTLNCQRTILNITKIVAYCFVICTACVTHVKTSS